MTVKSFPIQNAHKSTTLTRHSKSKIYWASRKVVLTRKRNVSMAETLIRGKTSSSEIVLTESILKRTLLACAESPRD